MSVLNVLGALTLLGYAFFEVLDYDWKRGIKKSGEKMPDKPLAVTASGIAMSCALLAFAVWAVLS